MNLHIEIEITKDKSGAQKYTQEFIKEKIVNGEAYIKKKASLSFIILGDDILGRIKHIDFKNYKKMDSVLSKKINHFRDKMYEEQDRVKEKNKYINDLNKFINHMIFNKQITRQEIIDFIDKRKEIHENKR